MARRLARWRTTIVLCVISVVLFVSVVRIQQNFDDHTRVITRALHNDQTTECVLRIERWRLFKDMVEAIDVPATERARLLKILGPFPNCETR